MDKKDADWRDPIVEEIRRRSDEYGARFDYDLEAIFLDLKRQQDESGRRVVSLSRDPIVEEVRRHGEEYAAQFENLDAMVLDLMRRQEERGGELVSFSRKEQSRDVDGQRKRT